jgi:aryl-alcohol dehydrogenase-like predicted oxidoreductase
MEYTNLGRTGLKVSRLCLGTMNFGPKTSEEDSFKIMDKAIDLGINFFDTANVYGWKTGEGITENIIGRWLAQGKGWRERIVLATKVYGKMGEWPNQRGLSAYHIRQACEDSLRRMQTDHIDLYQMHHIDRSTTWEEIWQAMEVLIQQGKVLYIGSSNFAATDIIQAQYEAKTRHSLGLISEQSLYNLKDRMIELEVIPACRKLGIGIIPWSPLAGGLFAGTLVGDKNSRRTSESVQNNIKKHASQIQDYKRFCQTLGESPAELALAWLLHNPSVTTPIIGPRTIQQLENSLHALDIKLSQDTMNKLDQIWPGPGGQAPEAYAW